MTAVPKSEAIRKALKAIVDFEGGIHDPHRPGHMWCSCVDGREKAGSNLKLSNDTIRVTEISASFPPYENLSTGLRSKFCFRELKGIPIISIVGHSDCGGAQAAVAYPNRTDAPNENIATVVQTLADTGIDIPYLRHSFMLVSDNNTTLTADLLSRHIVLKSFGNILRYPNIGSQVMNGDLHVVPYYHVMKTGSGQRSHMERYDVKNQTWIPAAQNAMTELYRTPDGSFAEHLEAVDHALKGVMVTAAINGGQEEVEIPRHIARLLGKEEKRAGSQPKPMAA